GHPGLVPDELLKLVGIGDARFALDVGKLLGDFGVDVEIQFLGFGLQQKLIDALTEYVLVGLRQRLLKTLTGRALLAHGSFHLLAGAINVAARNDLAIYFGDDLFDDRNLSGGSQASGRNACEDQRKAHTGIIASRRLASRTLPRPVQTPAPPAIFPGRTRRRRVCQPRHRAADAALQPA